MLENFVIGIAGGSGSGKTTFIDALKTHFSLKDVCVISQDNYYKSRDEQIEDHQGIKNFDLPSSLNLDEYLNDIKRLVKGESVSRQEYTFNNEKKTPSQILLQPAPIIIAEGLFVFCNEELKNIYDLKIMIDATDDKKIIRRIKRDRIERNYPLEDVLYRYEHHVVPSYLQYIVPHKQDADIIINNNITFSSAMEVVLAFIKYKLEEIKKATDKVNN
jgi:uridine kinase